MRRDHDWDCRYVDAPDGDFDMEQLAEQYQTLYRHMAEQSKFLAKVQEPLFREPEVEETGDAANSEEPGLPPRDYAGASGLLKQPG